MLGSLSCSPSTSAPPVTQFRPITLAQLAAEAPRFTHEKVSFPATVEQVEETPQGLWLHLKDGEQRLLVYSPMTFGGSLREALGQGQMDFDVEIGERTLTPLGTTALALMPYQIRKTHYFAKPQAIEPPPTGSGSPR
jgi:hypothetical protein